MSRAHAAALALAALMAMPLIHGCASDSQAQQQQDSEMKTFPDSRSAATQGLDALRKAITADNYRELGFNSSGEALAARLGTPLHVFMVRLDRLREYSAGTDAGTLLADNRQDHYPVEVGEQARASIVTEQVPRGWAAVSMGNTGLARQIETVKRMARPSAGARPEDTALVQVPALGVFFLGHRRPDGRWELTPLADQPRLDMRAGATMPAEQALAALVPAARAYNGLPM